MTSPDAPSAPAVPGVPAGREDPGPAPDRGLVVRAQGEGFYARVLPRPVPSPRIWGPGLAVFLAVGVGLAWLYGDGGWLSIEIALCIVLFGLLLLAFAFGAGFFPVEIVVDDRTVTWGGERIPMGLVSDCRMAGRTLELVGPGDRILAKIEGVLPDAGRWVSLAIRASLPPSG
jgi:hypothetical protein